VVTTRVLSRTPSKVDQPVVTFATKDVRRIVIEVECRVWPDVLIESAPGKLLREAIDAQVGTMTEAVGRVVAIDHFDVRVPMLGHFSDGEPYIVTAHAAQTFQVR
jgi:hypothetical protein